jgi:hypothetical protein
MNKRRRVTAAEVERCVDTLADIMDKMGHRAHLCVPLWKRLERELERLQEEEAIVTAARDRVRQSRDRMAAQSA